MSLLKQRANNLTAFNPPYLPAISFFITAYLLFYLWWRLTYTLNHQALSFSIILLLAEAFGVVNYMLFAWMTHDVSPRYPYRPPKAGISVDVFIPTYNEGLDILEATLIGCQNITYPHSTFVLDDGKRDEVKRLAERLGCYYITRPDNQHAKAGNINHALKYSVGEFIVVLDADTVPQPDFLDRTLGYFENEQLAFVQTPQEFYNKDSIQHDRRSSKWHEQSLFYRVIQPGKNASGSAFWCGSPSIIRRAALNDVGGVATETITEDIHTSVRLHAKGWESLYLNEVLAYGIAPETIQAFLLQRLRWAQGTMQLYRSKESPLWIPGLTLKQRLSYLSSFLAYFEAFQKLFFILVPSLIILFDVFPMDVNGLVFLVFWFPYFFFTYLANQVLGRGYFNYLQTEKFNLIKMITFIQSTFTLFSNKSLGFKVTPKSVDKTVYKLERRSLRGYMVMLGALIGVILFGFYKTIFWTGSLPFGTYLVAYFWAFYNAGLIFLSICEVFRKRHDRKQYRFKTRVAGELYSHSTKQMLGKVNINDLSVAGAGLSMDFQLSKEQQDIVLHFNTFTNKFILLPIKKVTNQRVNRDGTVHVGVSFGNVLSVYHDRLLEFLFVNLQSYDANCGYQKEIKEPAANFQMPSFNFPNINEELPQKHSIGK